jgi:hypothetical protein
MSTAALNVRSVPETHQLCRVRETHLPCAACAKRTATQSTISLRSLCSFMPSGECPYPRPGKNAIWYPKISTTLGELTSQLPVAPPLPAFDAQYSSAIENTQTYSPRPATELQIRGLSPFNPHFADVNGGPAQAEKNVRPPEP